MIDAANLGYPRFGAKRELKSALEDFWNGKSSEGQLIETTRQLRQTHWKLQRQAGIDVIPSNDFSLYDQTLDTAAMVGAVPARYGWTGDLINLTTYFAMARGIQHPENKTGLDVPSMEMTKWFDTNYHYIVPEFESKQQFRLSSTKIIDEFIEAQALGIMTRPVLLGPVSFLLLGKSTGNADEPLSLLPDLLPVYADVLKRLAAAGADWVQVDEPCLVLDLTDAAQAAYQTAYAYLANQDKPKLLLATYFGGLRDNLALTLGLPVQGIHLDLVRAPEQLDAALREIPAEMILSLGLIDGRNIWRTDLDKALGITHRAVNTLGVDRLQIAPSCSLLFSPHDLDLETDLDPDLRSWLAFATQKLAEIVVLKRALTEGIDSVAETLTRSRQALENRRMSERTHNPAVRERIAAITPAMLERQHPYIVRRVAQVAHLHLPKFPTTTIGSFPQTKEVRAKRADFNAGRITQDAYEVFLKAEIERTVRLQEDLGLDVLVHGEFERTDMVEYFGEHFTGVAFTQHGWVQSYGSRGVRPPIIYGDVARPEPITVKWAVYAQSLTQKPMKGMLTGPVTILEWSFVRDDLPRSETCRQIALAIRDEVMDLEAAGISIIQIDEPAVREGLPLRRADWFDYLQWAVDCFRLAAAGVRDETQIHTHMCYAEFNDIIEAIGRMDADVISIEASRSHMELLDAFIAYRYPNEIGPGVYDIHSPRVPSREEIEHLLHKALAVLAPDQLWINPDCGLKTRRWEEVLPALRLIVETAHHLREERDGAFTA